jgi:glutathione S-transferase
VHRTLEQCRAALRASLDGVTAATAGEAPDGKWSIAGIIDHLDLAYMGTTAAIERRLEKGTPLEPRPMTVRQRIGRLLILRLGSVLFPTGREAPKHLVPQGRRFAEVSAVIEPHLLVLDQRLKQAALAFGSRAPVANHPFLGPCSVADWRRFHWSHTRHHLKQVAARRARIDTASAASR